MSDKLSETDAHLLEALNRHGLGMAGPFKYNRDEPLYDLAMAIAEARDALEVLERSNAALREDGGRLVLRSGIAGDYDGAYDWVRDEDYDNPDYALGYHDGGWAGEGYTVVEVRKAAGGT